jgi:guanylate kinase
MKKPPASNGKIFVISAPSGCGKTTLANRLLEDELGLTASVSVTTRDPRPGEKDGRDYHFVTEDKFKKMVGRGEFLEQEENFGHFYGTPKKPIEKVLKSGRSVLLNIDVKGAMRVRRAHPDDSVLIFIMPPSITALKKRLHGRKADKAEEIKRRLDLAKKEISYKDKYDHIVVNDRLDTAYRKLRKIVIAQEGK